MACSYTYIWHTYQSDNYLSYYYTAISTCYFMCTIIMPCQKLCRFMKHEVGNLNFICEGLDNGNICPACPKVSKLNTLCILDSQLFYYTWQNSGSLFISMDALFGLSRKKSAGKSVRTPLTGDLFSRPSCCWWVCVYALKGKTRHNQVKDGTL